MSETHPDRLHKIGFFEQNGEGGFSGWVKTLSVDRPLVLKPCDANVAAGSPDTPDYRVVIDEGEGSDVVCGHGFVETLAGHSALRLDLQDPLAHHRITAWVRIVDRAGDLLAEFH